MEATDEEAADEVVLDAVEEDAVEDVELLLVVRSAVVVQ